jgi:hypothetical protein
VPQAGQQSFHGKKLGEFGIAQGATRQMGFEVGHLLAVEARR